MPLPRIELGLTGWFRNPQDGEASSRIASLRKRASDAKVHRRLRPSSGRGRSETVRRSTREVNVVRGSHMPLRWWCIFAVLAVSMVVFVASAAAAREARVTVGSPPTPFPQNKQNEPAVAIDASRPSIVAAGSNDELDLAPCGTTAFATDESPCPFTPGVGVSGVYFSFDNGASWVQPAYTGWSARDGTPKVGPHRNAALVLRERPRLRRRSGRRVRADPAQRRVLVGERVALYYANLTSSFPAAPLRLRRDTARSWTRKRRPSGTWRCGSRALPSRDRSRASKRSPSHVPTT